jgi:toxin ParE1/3/4
MTVQNSLLPEKGRPTPLTDFLRARANIQAAPRLRRRERFVLSRDHDWRAIRSCARDHWNHRPNRCKRCGKRSNNTPRVARYCETRLAKQDLLDAIRFIARDDADAAAHFYHDVQERYRQLADHNGMGRKRPDLAPHVRSFPSADYIILYRTVRADVVILRFLHGARDLHALL